MVKCSPDCPDRKLHCHRTCKRYLCKTMQEELTRRRIQKLKKENAFFREERRAVKRIGLQRATDRKRHKANER